MSINLLPTEEKNKSRKYKIQPTPIVEMTGPVRMEKSRPAIKRGGVLGFFKQVFATPKPIPEAEKNLPEKKIIVEEKVSFVKPQPQPAPRPIVKMVAPIPEKMQVERHGAPGAKVGGFFRALFGKKESAPPISQPLPSPLPQDQFPKYKPIHAEAVHPASEEKRPRPPEIITVTMNGHAPEPEHKDVPREVPAPQRFDIPHEGFPKTDPAFTVIKQTSVPAPVVGEGRYKMSLWQRISRWFKSLFVHQVPQHVAEAKEPTISPEPKKAEPQLMIRTEKKIIPAERPVSQPVRPVPPPTPPKPFVTTPAPVRQPDLEPLRQAPPMPERFTTPPVPVEKHDVVPPSPKLVVPPPPPPLEKKMPLADDKDDKPEAVTPWWQRIWALIMNMFKGRSVTMQKKVMNRQGSVQSIPGVRLTDVPGIDNGMGPIEWEVNLVPEEAIEKELPISKILIGILCVIVSVGVVFGGWVTANYYYSNVTAKVSGLNGQIESNRIEINGYQDVQVNVRELNQQIATIQTLLTKHVYWSGIFDKLEHYTVSGVYFTSMTADVNGSVSLAAIGGRYEDAVKQLQVFERATDFVSKVTVSGVCFLSDAKCSGTSGTNVLIQPTEQTVKFSVNLTVLPSLFYWPR